MLFQSQTVLTWSADVDLKSVVLHSCLQMAPQTKRQQFISKHIPE